MTYPDFLKEIETKNNYKIKVKGSSVGKNNCFNNQLVIIKKALINHFLENKSIYDTINENQDLIDYQIVKKRTAKTKYIDYTHQELLDDKVIRVFPVTKDGIQILTDKLSNIPDVPELALLVKENIIGKHITDIPNLDINYYIKKFNDELESWMTGTSEEKDEK